MKRLLMVAYYFPPTGSAGAFRALGFARHLPESGWEPVVVAPGVVPDEPHDDELLKVLPPRTHLVFTRTPPQHPSTRPDPSPSPSPAVPGSPRSFPRRLAHALLQRPHSKIEWLPAALAASLRVVTHRRVHAIYTTSPPAAAHLVGLLLKTFTRIPWIADFRDPWELSDPDDDLAGVSRSIDRFYHRRVVQSADAVVGATHAITRINQRLCHDTHKLFLTITNGYEPDDFPNLDPPDSSTPLDRFVVSHVGELYGARDIGPFLEAVSLFLDRDTSRRPRFSVQLVGRTGEDVRSMVHRGNLDDVVVLVGQTSHARALELSARSGALLLLQGPDFHDSIPSKLYEYLACRRPILALTDPAGQTARLLDSLDSPSLRADCHDPHAIARALETLYTRRESHTPPTSHTDSLLRFSRPVLTRQLAQCLDNLCRH